MNIHIPIFGSCQCKLPIEVTDKILSESYYKQYSQRKTNQPTYSSFKNMKGSYEEKEIFTSLEEFYSPIIDSFMKQIGHYKDVTYNWEIWWQIYEPYSSGFNIHKHTGGVENASSLISFNHFVKTIPNRSFFTWVFGNKREILHEEIQDQLIFFAGHAFHRVQKNDTNQYRLTVSGNILMNDGVSYYEDENCP